MKKIIILLIFLIIVTVNITAQWETGNTLIDSWKDYKQDKGSFAAGLFMGYVRGALDSRSLIGYLESLSNGQYSFAYEIPTETTMKQICQIFGRYLENHPEKWTDEGYYLLYLALTKAYPKK
jgi:hypothetical protein